MRRLIFISLFGAFLVAILGVGHIYVRQEERLFQIPTLPDDYTFGYAEPHRELYLDVGERAQINALHFTAEDSKGVVLYFHGRGGNLSHRMGKISRQFTERGYDFFAMDYRRFGKSRGKLSEAAICSDAEACYTHLLETYGEDEIVVYGRSLGTGVATYVAARHSPKALLLESPYMSILDLTPRELPYFPKFLIPMLLKYHFRLDQWILAVNSPIHIFHGTEDEIIPYDSSTRLLNLLSEKQDVSLISIEAGKHDHLRKDSQYQLRLDQVLN